MTSQRGTKQASSQRKTGWISKSAMGYKLPWTMCPRLHLGKDLDFRKSRAYDANTLSRPVKRRIPGSVVEETCL